MASTLNVSNALKNPGQEYPFKADALIEKMEVLGDPVQFVCADGEIFSYVVSGHETLQPRAVEEMLDNASDLTLFTCTYGGRTRVTVRLSRVLAY